MERLLVIKRNGELADFDSVRIRNAIQKAVKVTGQEMQPELIDELVSDICAEIEQRFVDLYPNVENIQDAVEKHLVKKGLYEISKEYILYRANRQNEREEERKQNIEKAKLGKLKVKKRDGRIVLFDASRLRENLLRI